MSDVSDLDALLSVVENPTRRRILEALVREPHYPLQLSRELGMSQQAIMKHLKVLEDHDMVRSYVEESDQGGPNRKIYVPTTKFTIIVDFGPGLFETTFVKLAMGSMHWERLLPRAALGPVELPDIGTRMVALRGEVAEVDEALQELQAARERLIGRKEAALEEAVRIIEGSIEDYDIRRVVYMYVQSPTLSAREMAEALGMRDRVVEETIRKLEEQRLGKGGKKMAGKEIKSQSEKYAQELIKLLNRMGDEIEKAANKLGKMGEEAYETLPPKAKAATKDMQSVVDSVTDNLRQDIPKMQKNLENMAKRMGEYASDVQRAMRGSKK